MRSIAFALGLCASTAFADVSPSDQDAMFDVMKSFGEALETSTVHVFFDERLHPAFWDAFAQYMGQSTDTLKAQSLDGLEAYYATLEVSDFDLVESTALFGMSLDWTWGVIAAQTVVRENGGAPLADCVSMMVFGKDGEWFISEVVEARELLITAIPAMAFAKFNHPACDLIGNYSKATR